MPIKQRNLRTTIYIAAFLSILVFYNNPVFSANASKTVTVDMEDSYFSPATITISAGQKVVWVNKGEKNHNVKSYDGYFTSNMIPPGGKFSYTFTKPGTYTYYCGKHSIWHMGMVGKVNVK